MSKSQQRKYHAKACISKSVKEETSDAQHNPTYIQDTSYVLQNYTVINKLYNLQITGILVKAVSYSTVNMRVGQI